MVNIRLHCSPDSRPWRCGTPGLVVILSHISVLCLGATLEIGGSVTLRDDGQEKFTLGELLVATEHLVTKYFYAKKIFTLSSKMQTQK